MTIAVEPTTTTTIRLILEVTRESDDSYSLSLEDDHFAEDSDERYVDGLSEGYLCRTALLRYQNNNRSIAVEETQMRI